MPQGEIVDANFYLVQHLKISYMAMWVSGPGEPKAASELFDRMLEALNRVSVAKGLPCEFNREKDMTLNGYVGRKYNVEGCYFHGGIRLYYKMEGKILKTYMVGVLGEDPNDPSINQFLDSFVIR
jgi:hypothetical protein